MSPYSFLDYCVCPVCQSSLLQDGEHLVCKRCQANYPVKDGIANLMPQNYKDDRYREYYDSYEVLAQDDLKSPLEVKREYRHDALLRFIGNTNGKRVLDIGSSSADYLRLLDAEFRVAFDIARPFLASIPSHPNLQKIQGDAEYLPFIPGFFDSIIIADVLEHILCPERLIERLENICTRKTKIIVHIPWEEDLTSYINQPYKYTHLRSFNSFTFHDLWKNFSVVKTRSTYPNLNSPLLFRLENKIPHFLFDRLKQYYYRSLAVKDYNQRVKHMKSLPKGEWWLLRLYKPVFRIFELKIRNS